MKRLILQVLVVGVAVGGFCWADDDEPGRGVARISVLNGDVSVRRGDSGDWVAAAINSPLVVEDRVATGTGSRAEVQFDWANMIRLGGNAEIRLSELENQRYQIQIAHGTVTFRVLRDSDADVELSTPSVSVRPAKRGEYRISVRDDGTSEITVRSGEAEIFTTRGSERLRSGKTMLARGSYADPEFQIVSAIDRDEWDRWNELRDRDLERSGAYRYVNRSIYGAEDLDGHGEWVNTPPYGWCWRPRVAIGWAPYRHGRWVWTDWYGWTWVSHDPWGWAPYHYGRWFYHGSRWCWWPGAYRARTWWRPALVGFVGWNSWGGVNVGIGIGFGRVGWFPLAPYEPFHPWYGRRYYRGWGSRGYGGNGITIVNNTNITNIYRNARLHDAVTVVDGGDFSRGRAGNAVRITNADLQRASLVRGPVPIAPARESLRMADRDARVSPRGGDNRTFYSRRAPARVDRVSFDDQRRGVEQIARRAAGQPEVAARGDAAADQRGNRGASGAESRLGGGWRRVGDAGTSRASESAVSPRGGSAQSESGWRRIGEGSRSDRGQSDESFRGTVTGAREATTVSPRSSSGKSDRGSGWRRFGQPDSGALTRDADAPGRSGRSGGRETDGWQRFGQPDTDRVTSSSSRSERGSSRSESSMGSSRQSPAESPRGSASPSSGSDGWQRMRGGSSSGRSVESSPTIQPRGDSSRGGEATRTESPRSGSPSRDRGGRNDDRSWNRFNSGSARSSAFAQSYSESSRGSYPQSINRGSSRQDTSGYRQSDASYGAYGSRGSGGAVTGSRQSYGGFSSRGSTGGFSRPSFGGSGITRGSGSSGGGMRGGGGSGGGRSAGGGGGRSSGRGR